MPEIGYWKYVRFNDDEPQYFGTDDDVTIVFDSADDRLEYRMKKNIRFEDDAGNKILTIQKATRTLSGFKMTGDLEIEKHDPVLHLDATTGKPFIRFWKAGVAHGQLYVDTASNEYKFSNLAQTADTFKIYANTGSITKVGDIDMGGNLLKNARLGSNLKTGGWDIFDGVSDANVMYIIAGSTVDWTKGAGVVFYGAAHATLPGFCAINPANINNTSAYLSLRTANTTPVLLDRIRINQGDDPDIDIKNAKLDFHDQTLEATAGAIAGYFRLKVGDTEYKVPAYALT